MRSLHSPIRRRRFMVKFFWAKFFKISAIDSVTKRVIQAKQNMIITIACIIIPK